MKTECFFKKALLLVHNNCTGDFVCCDISIYAYNVLQSGSSPPLCSLSPFLKWLPQVSMFHIYTCIESTATIFTLSSSFTLPLPLAPSLNMTCFTFLSFFVLVSVHCAVCFALVFYLWVHCTLISLTPLFLFLTLFSYRVFFNGFQCILLCLVPTEMQCISILFTRYPVILFSSFLNFL
jgi:hypothetical protein